MSAVCDIRRHGLSGTSLCQPPTANRCVLQVLCVNYRLPPEQPHLSKVMEDTVLEPPILTELDMPQV